MGTPHNRTVIAVDDDEVNLMILVKNIEDAGYKVKAFPSGDSAWEYMSAHPQDADIAVLDKMMPGLSGLELLKRIKVHDALKRMPVIIQTGDAGIAQMREGLESGAYYYLTKPFHPEILAAILNSAANECSMREEMLEQLNVGNAEFINLLHDGRFYIKTHEEARTLAATLSQIAAYPELAAIGLMEILANAIEHGNLEIGYRKKQKCLVDKTWDEELKTRADNLDFGDRVVQVKVEKTPAGLSVAVIDEGKGFDWRQFMYDENGRLNEPNGRGIAKAMTMLDELRYVGKGNEVHCHIAAPHMTQQFSGELPTARRLHS